MPLREGQRIAAPFLAEIAKVKRFEPKPGYYLLEVVLQDGHNTYQPLRITEDQLAAVQILERDRVALSEDAEGFFVFVEANRIRLSANEWKKARHFGEKFWLYVVTGAGTNTPQLHRIQNPLARFRVGEDVLATGYIIHEETWRKRAR